MKVMDSNEELTGTDLEAKPGDLSNMSQDKYYLHKYRHVNTRHAILLIHNTSTTKRKYFLTVLWKIQILGLKLERVCRRVLSGTLILITKLHNQFSSNVN